GVYRPDHIAGFAAVVPMQRHALTGRLPVRDGLLEGAEPDPVLHPVHVIGRGDRRELAQVAVDPRRALDRLAFNPGGQAAAAPGTGSIRARRSSAYSSPTRSSSSAIRTTRRRKSWRRPSRS